MAGKPTGWNRLMAKLGGEVSAAELEAYRRAGGHVFDLMDQVERRRLECGIDGLDPWTVPAATRAAFLCAWNAFVLQTVANDLLDADYAHDPGTSGYLPAVTAAQARGLYAEVEGWVSRGWQASANPAYRLDWTVPAPFPAWVRTRSVPPAHLHGLLRGMRSVHEHADAAMSFLPAEPPADAEKQAQLNRIRQLHASAQVSARYAEELGTFDAAGGLGHAADRARAAIEQLYLLGQWIADPARAAEPRPAPEPPRRQPSAARSPATPITPRLAGGWPVGTQPGLFSRPLAVQSVPRASGGPPAGNRATSIPGDFRPAAAVMTLLTSRDGQDRVVTEPAIPVEFIGKLRQQARFALRPALVRGRTGTTVVLRVETRGRDGYTGLTEGTVTLHVDGEEVVLSAGPERRMRASIQGLHDERAAFPLPAGMLERIGRARKTWLRFQIPGATLYVDAETAARFRASCRAFHHLVREHAVEAAKKARGGGRQ